MVRFIEHKGANLLLAQLRDDFLSRLLRFLLAWFAGFRPAAALIFTVEDFFFGRMARERRMQSFDR